MNKTILVAGAGTGIGRAIAVSLAKEYSVVLLGRTSSSLEKTLDLLPNREAHRLAVADIRDAQALRAAFQKIELESMNLSGIIANSGVGGENKYGPGDRWDDLIATNLTGTYQLVNEALPALRKSQSEYKHIVITASILARLGVPGYSAYCASKAGLLGLMRSWAAEFASEKILVNAVCPGWVETQMATDGIQAMATAMNIPYEKAYEMQMKAVPLGKMSQPEEIADFIRYLVSPSQKSITGQSLDINNGALMP